ncbi:MAG TPA: TolC family protein, partial [Thermoanaerobaculia bacterium]|nr:TolC family protein [Thermoanaerobaculia bacterium]
MPLRVNPRNRRGAVAALALCLLVSGMPARAQDTVVSTDPVQPDSAPSVEVRESAIQLSLDQAIEIAMRYNLGLIAERYTRTQQRLGITQGLSIYDLRALADIGATQQESPVFDITQASEANNQNAGFSFRQLLPTGGELEVGMDTVRRESNAESARADLTFSSGLDFSYTQPLLRNFGRLATERDIIIARTTSRISGEDFERQVTLTIQQVVNAYWNLVGAREQLGVARQSLNLARQLHDRNRIQVEVGTLAPLELVQSEAAIATNEEDII